MQKKSFDYMIVGQGIAGSVLAISLIKAGFKICVIDKPLLSTSSKVAAGIWNPVVFKRLAKSWMADEIVPELIRFYETFEKESNTRFIFHRPILKAFTEEQEKVLWQKKAISENDYLDKTIYSDLAITENTSVTSYSKVLRAGNIDIPVFLNATTNYIINNGYYLEDTFDYDKLVIEEEYQYENLVSNNIIFCEGYLISKNPYFNWIPLKPAKGEVLTIKCANLNIQESILNKGIFIMPLAADTYKVGATYQWDNLNDSPTESKKQELINKLTSLINTPFEIIAHQAGVRPSVIDRRPVIGAHPKHKTMYLFNGFGTKAVMLVPFFAKQLINHINSNDPILEEVNVSRFDK